MYVTHMHVQRPTYIYEYMHTCTHARTYTQMHVHAHTHSGLSRLTFTSGQVWIDIFKCLNESALLHKGQEGNALPSKPLPVQVHLEVRRVEVNDS